MKTNPRRSKSAFTLIELMAVITIIVILAALVVGGLGFVTEKQAKAKAQVQLALLSRALEEYKLDMGTYPLTANTTTGLGNSSNSLYIPLFFEGYDYLIKGSPAVWVKAVGSNTNFPKATKIYLPELDPTSTKQGWVTTATTVPGSLTAGIVDPWGKEYAYRTADPLTGTTPNAATQNPDFDLWTYGKDGFSVASPADPKNRDDIKNF